MPKPGICQDQSPISGAGTHPPDTIAVMGIQESEIYKALFDLTQAIAGHADLPTLCNSLADSLRRVVSFDYLGLVLHDPVRDQLRLHAVSANMPYEEKSSSFQPTTILPAPGFGASKNHS